MIMAYFYNQPIDSDIKLCYSTLTMDQFYDSLIVPGVALVVPPVPAPALNYNDTGMGIMILAAGMVFIGLIVKWNKKIR
jgi:hypothetical protein